MSHQLHQTLRWPPSADALRRASAELRDVAASAIRGRQREQAATLPSRFVIGAILGALVYEVVTSPRRAGVRGPEASTIGG